MRYKNPNWKQKTPIDQLTAIRASLEGHMSNWKDGIIGNDLFLLRLDNHLQQIAWLELFLKGEESW